MEITEKISVIVPVYKVEAYLDRCVQSIVDQTYRNLEIILVDDDSPDNCGSMCDAWAQKDSRVKVIHKPNGGLSDARNAGMAAATGAYIGFVDSDDYIAPDMYRLLYERMRADESDIAACGVMMVYEDTTPSRLLTPSGTRILNKNAAMEAIIRESSLKQPVWYKLYKTALISDIPFPVGKCHEDVFWTWQAIAKAEKVSVFDTPLYFYTQRSGGIMGSRYDLRRLDALEAKLLRLSCLQKNYPGLVPTAKAELHFFCLYCAQMALLHMTSQEKHTAMEMIHSAMWKYSPDLAEIRSVPFTQKLWICLSRLSFMGTCRLRNFLKIGI